MVGPQPARYRLAVGSGQKSGRVEIFMTRAHLCHIHPQHPQLFDCVKNAWALQCEIHSIHLDFGILFYQMLITSKLKDALLKC